MRVAALQKTTLLDYPGKLACIVFLSGCNFKCPFCYSSELVLPEKIKKLVFLKENDIFEFLKKRKGKLKGVVICGGEPTVNPDLPLFCRKVKNLGYSVKLDTNGSNPKMVQTLLREKLIDYIALDIKTSKENYFKAIGLDKKTTEKALKNIEKTITLLKKSSIDWEARTTCVPGVIAKEDIIKIGQWLKGAKKYYLQQFVPKKTLEPSFEKVKPYLDKEMEEMRQIALPYCPNCQIR